MRTIITIENGRIEISVDDGAPVLVSQPSTIKHDIVPPQEPSQPIPPLSPTPTSGEKALSPQKPKKKALDLLDPERKCEICSDDISHRNKNAKICAKPSCIAEKNRRRMNANYQKKRKTTPDTVETDQEAFYCKHCRAYRAHSTADHFLKTHDSPKPINTQITGGPEFLPGHEKTPEELAAIRDEVDGKASDFKDPWNCGVCRSAGELSMLHAQMTSEGKTPPKFRRLFS